MRYWTARVQGNLDDAAGNLLPDGPHCFLGVAQIYRIKSVPISLAQRADARRLSGSALARVAATQCSRRMVRRTPLGGASGYRAIGRLGD